MYLAASRGANVALQAIVVPHHLGVGGYCQIGIYLAEQNDSGNSLEISWQLFRGITALPDVQAQRKVLPGGLDQLNFAYFGSHSQTDMRPNPAPPAQRP
jgi:hypothetical protein